MITFVTFMNLTESLNIGGLTGTKFVNPWEAIQKDLAGTDDTVVFVVSVVQREAFVAKMKQYALEKYLIVDHRGERGITNRNYPDKLRLKLFVFKGAKNAS